MLTRTATTATLCLAFVRVSFTHGAAWNGAQQASNVACPLNACFGAKFESESAGRLRWGCRVPVLACQSSCFRFVNGTVGAPRALQGGMLP